jgi:indolepyruvate ferredoxin oxidoreductase beta subunit
MKDPYNVIITGVGGQGNVVAARILGNIMAERGYKVTIGETFGASQRGGSVMSHLRISGKTVFSPQIPKGQADLVVALEPIESVRVMAGYGNMNVKVLANTRSIYPVSVICGEQNYPAIEELKASLAGLCSEMHFIPATDEAVKLGHAILGNVMMIGAVAGLGVLPFDESDFEKVMAVYVSGPKMAVNLKAFEKGMEMVKNN